MVTTQAGAKPGPLQTSAPKAYTPHPREEMSGLPDTA